MIVYFFVWDFKALRWNLSFGDTVQHFQAHAMQFVALHAPEKIASFSQKIFDLQCSKITQKMLHATWKKIKRVLFFSLLHAIIKEILQVMFSGGYTITFSGVCNATSCIACAWKLNRVTIYKRIYCNISLKTFFLMKEAKFVNCYRIKFVIAI